MAHDLVKTSSSWFPVVGEGVSTRPNAKKFDKWGSIFRKAAEDGIHLIKEDAKRAWVKE